MITEFKTTFWDDFTIADAFGEKGVKDTFERAFNEWKDNYVYLTELVIVMNWKCWQHYDEGHGRLSLLYQDYYYKADAYALDHLKGKELQYYLREID